MREYDGPALRAFDYAHRASVSDAQLLALTAIHLSRAAGDLSGDAAQFAGPFDLPAGRFAARIAFAGAAPGEDAGSVSVLLSDRPSRAGAQTASMPIAHARATSATAVTFDLPFDASVRLAASNVALTPAAQEVDIVAESIVPRRARTLVDVRAVEAIAGRAGAFIVYGDEDTYPEGGLFWTRGTRAGKVFVLPAGASTLVLTLHVGPVTGLVRVMVDGQDRSVTLSRDQTLRLEMPLAKGARLVPIVVEAPGSFRPSDHEPGSTDRRRLGCQVRVELQ
jgi:hypothetical protein